MKWDLDYNNDDFEVVVDSNYRRDYSHKEENYKLYILEVVIPHVKYEREIYNLDYLGLSDIQAMIKYVDGQINNEKWVFDFSKNFNESFLKRIKRKIILKKHMVFFDNVKKMINETASL
jgi:hypothetical protein